MPTSVRLSDLISSFQQGNNGGTTSPFVLINGKYEANPAFLNDQQQAQLSQTVNGPTSGAIQGSAAQAAAQEAAKNAVSQYAPLTPEQLGASYSANGTALPVGTTPTDLKGQTLLTKDQKTSLGEINAVQNIIDQVKSASSAVNVNNSGDGSHYGTYNLKQYLHGLSLKSKGDVNAQFLDKGVTGLLGQIGSGELGVNRYSPEEIHNIQANIPTPFDTKDVAASKIGHLQELLDIKKKEIMPQTVQSAMSAASSPMAQSPQSDPLGLFSQQPSQ